MNVTLTRAEIIEACKEWLWNKHQIQPKDTKADATFTVWTGEGMNFGRETPKDVTLEFTDAIGTPYRG